MGIAKARDREEACICPAVNFWGCNALEPDSMLILLSANFEERASKTERPLTQSASVHMFKSA